MQFISHKCWHPPLAGPPRSSADLSIAMPGINRHDRLSIRPLSYAPIADEIIQLPGKGETPDLET